MTASALRSPGQVDLPGAEAVNAPLFHALMEQLDPGRRWVVLDLGPAQPAVLALLGGRRCRLDVVDLAGDLGRLAASDDPAKLARTAEALLPPPGAEPVDVVLCWDLLNYLDRPAMRALMSRVAERTRPGAMVHALMAYSRARMPATPARCTPADDHRLLIGSGGPQRDAPRYTPEDLGKCLTGFRMDRAVLMRNGMQEFLFRR